MVDTQWGAGWAVTPARLSDRRRSDLVFYNPQTGAARLASSDGRGGFTYQARTWPAGLAVQAADLEGDGRDDLFGYSPRSGVWWTAAFSSRGVSESTGNGPQAGTRPPAISTATAAPTSSFTTRSADSASAFTR